MSRYDFTRLSLDKQRFVLELSNKSIYEIDGATKENIIGSKSQYLELKNGTVVNKAFIVEIRYSHDLTNKFLTKLPEDERMKIAELCDTRTEEEKKSQKGLLEIAQKTENGH